MTDISDLVKAYAGSAQCAALAKMSTDDAVRRGYVEGARASAMAVMAAGMRGRVDRVCVFVLDDAEIAGYFYHDLTQMMGNNDVLFFPSSYRRQVKYGQKDAANEILRTEVLGRIISNGRTRRDERAESTGNEAAGQISDGDGHIIDNNGQALYIVSYPEALAEMVVAKREVASRTITLRRGGRVGMTELAGRMRELGFSEVDYVYEPGQFAMRGSIMDVFSFASEYPFRIDFFGDEIDSLRTFEVQSQLSKDKRDVIEIVPELAQAEAERMSLVRYLPDDTLLYIKDYAFCVNAVSKVYEDGFSRQAVQEQVDTLPEMEREEAMRRLRRENALVDGKTFAIDADRLKIIEFGAKPSFEPQARVTLDITAQPPMHKNFDLLARTIEDYTLKGYTTYILADSGKQLERIEEILAGDEREVRLTHGFTPVTKTLHAGYVDNRMKLCLFTDHQIFERFHKYSLRAAGNGAGRLRGAR